jgi:hypothetical protein
LNFKQTIYRFTIVAFFLTISCEKQNGEDHEVSQNESSFLSEIRPIYFDNLNFEAEAVLNNIPEFRSDFKNTYDKIYQNYTSGAYQSDTDLEYFRLIGQYYAFYLLALGGNYSEGNLSFDQINGGEQKGLYSGLSLDSDQNKKREMEKMMETASTVGSLAYRVNGYNDKAYGFYLAVKQVEQRIKNGNNLNSREAHDAVIDFVGVRLVNYDNIQNWNVLMSMVTMTNYNDPLNGFDNPKFNELFVHVNARLLPGTLPDLGGKFPEILGPLYRFDINLKRIEWLLSSQILTKEQKLEQLQRPLDVMKTSSDFVATEKWELLEAWPYKQSFYSRIKMMDSINEYQKSMNHGHILKVPDIRTYVNKKEFKQAYQCYSCHVSSGL